MFHCYYIASVVDLCLVSLIERILARHVVTHRQYLHLYTDPQGNQFRIGLAQHVSPHPLDLRYRLSNR